LINIEKTERAIKNGQSNETGNKTQDEDKRNKKTQHRKLNKMSNMA